MIIHVVTYKLFIVLNYVSKETFWFSMLFLFGFYIILIIVSVPFLSNLVEKDAMEVAYQTIGTGDLGVYLMLVIGAILPVVPDYGFNRISKML